MKYPYYFYAPDFSARQTFQARLAEKLYQKCEINDLYKELSGSRDAMIREIVEDLEDFQTNEIVKRKFEQQEKKKEKMMNNQEERANLSTWATSFFLLLLLGRLFIPIFPLW